MEADFKNEIRLHFNLPDLTAKLFSAVFAAETSTLCLRTVPGMAADDVNLMGVTAPVLIKGTVAGLTIHLDLCFGRSC